MRTVLHALIISVRPSDRDLRKPRRSDSRKTLIISLIKIITPFVRNSDAQAMPYGRSLCLGLVDGESGAVYLACPNPEPVQPKKYALQVR